MAGSGLPVPSNQIVDLKANAENFDAFMNSNDSIFTNRESPNGNVTTKTLSERLKELGYLPPVIYGAGVQFTEQDKTKTISRPDDGNPTASIQYAPHPTSLPFTTSGTWGTPGSGDDLDKFFLVQGLTASELPLYTDIVFDNVSDMVSGVSFQLQAGSTASTKGYYQEGDGGGGSYLITAPQSFDNLGDHELSNGNVAVLQDKSRATIRQYGALGDGVTNDAPSVAAADNGGAVILPQGDYVIGADLSIKNKPTVKSGAKFNVSSGFTLTVSSIDAEIEQMVFDGAGSVSGMQESWVDWFGAVADGATDDSDAVNKAIQATDGVVWFRKDDQGYVLNTSLELNKPITLDGVNRAKILCNEQINLFQVSSSDVTVQNLQITGIPAKAPNLFHLQTNTASIDRIFIRDLLTFSCARLVYDDNHATNTVISLYVEDVQHRLARERSVFLNDAFAFIFFTRVSLDYVGVTDVTTNVSAFSIANNQGCILTDVDVLGGEISGFSGRNGFNVEDSAAVFLRRCNADTMGGYGLRAVNVQGMRLETYTSSLCDQHGILIGGNTFDLQGVNVFAGGRNALSGIAAQHGIYITDSASDISLSNVITKENTGEGVKTDGTTGVIISGLTARGNTGRGLILGGTTALASGVRFGGNSDGNYSLIGALQHMTSAQLNSGALVPNATGPAAG